MIIPEIDSEILSQTTTLIKLVQLAFGTCLHTNKVKISNTDDSLPNHHFPQVNSSLEQIETNSMKHSTQILHLQRLYLIEDIYQFSLFQPVESQTRRQPGSFISESIQSQHSKEQELSEFGANLQQDNKEKTKKVCFFHKGEKRNHRFIKRNTKNVPKNFCKAFANYLEEGSNKLSEQWGLAIRKLKKIQKQQKYNNVTIKKIIQNQAIKPFFKDFLVNHAQEWINTSRIADKKVHIQAIAIFLDLIENLSYAEVDQSPSDQ